MQDCFHFHLIPLGLNLEDVALMFENKILQSICKSIALQIALNDSLVNCSVIKFKDLLSLLECISYKH